MFLNETPSICFIDIQSASKTKESKAKHDESVKRSKENRESSEDAQRAEGLTPGGRENKEKEPKDRSASKNGRKKSSGSRKKSPPVEVASEKPSTPPAEEQPPAYAGDQKPETKAGKFFSFRRKLTSRSSQL